MLGLLRHFIKKPVYRTYSNISISQKLGLVISAVGWNLVVGFALVIFIYGLSNLFSLDIGEHKADKIFKEYSTLSIFLMMVIVAPFLEEVIFRGPLIFFKRSSYFKWVFYLSCVLFGAVHLSNFENPETLLWISPLLVAPQIVMGLFLGFLRVKLGLQYAILMHMIHNGILLFLMRMVEYASPLP